MRLLFAGGPVCALIVCALTAPAQARRHCHGDCGQAGIEYEFSFGVEQLSLATQIFSSTITPLDSIHHNPLPAQTIAVTGRNVGAVHPLATVGEVHVFLMHLPHLAFGGKLGVLGGDFGKQVQTGDGALVNAGNTTGYVIGPEARAVFSRGPFELRGGVSFGYRNEAFDVPNRHVRCKGGVCDASVSASQFFVEPRVSVAINLPIVGFGGYAGGDVMPTGGWSAGGFVALHLGGWDKLGNIHTWSARPLYH